MNVNVERVTVLLVLFSAGVLRADSQGAPAISAAPEVVYNVRDYGAKGDGQADDTQAILKTLEAAGKNPACTSAQTVPETPYYGIQPEVLFPAGTYRLTAPIPLGHYARLRGEGNAALKPDKPDQDIFVPHPQGATWRIQISGLLLLGGGRAIALNTHNLDTGQILIQRCQFYGQNVAAVYCEDGCNSTLLKITDCSFLGCEQVLRNTCDMGVLSDCWICTRSTMKGKAVIENRGYLIAERIVGVPQPVPTHDQRWIDNHGSVTCRNFRFGGEGAGFTPIVNFATYSRKFPVIPSSIVLEDCPVYCLGNPKRKAAIYCVEVPNMITVRNCSGLVDVPVLLLDPAINPDAYFADALAAPVLCRYLLQDNTVNEAWGLEKLPPIMRRFSSGPKGAVNVRELFAGAGNGTNDDSPWLQMAMDYAAAARQPLVIPAGSYRIGKTINVTVGEVRGEGKPLIFAAQNDFDLFHADAWRITLAGLRFQGGRDQVSLGNPNTDQGMFTVRDCEFASADGVAVHFRKRSNSTSAHVERCAFNDCRQVLVTWCDGTTLRDCWITTSSRMKNMAAIENRDNLTCEKILGVPLVNGCDQRWIDNYGSLTCRDFRFGGEGGGFTPVVNFARRAHFLGGPKVVLDGCWVSALGNNQRACAVYCEEIPNQIAIANCELAGCPAVRIQKKLDLATYFAGVRPGMLRFDVARNAGEFAGQLPDELTQAAARRTGATDYGRAQLAADETARALAAAVAAAQKLPPSAPAVMEYQLPKGEKGRAQKTDPAKYVDLVPPRASWDLQACMDGSSQPNAERLAVAQAGARTVILKRIGADSEFGNWPHVLVKGVELDLDKTPWLSWRLADAGFKACGYAVKVTDESSGETVTLAEMHWPPFFDYRTYDLRKALGVTGGKRALQIKFYYLGLSFTSATECLTAKKGEYLVVDFLRAEAD